MSVLRSTSGYSLGRRSSCQALPLRSNRFLGRRSPEWSSPSMGQKSRMTSTITPPINPFTLHRHIALSQALKRPRFDWNFRRSPKLQAIDDVRDVHAPICLVHVKNDWLIGHDHSLALYEAANEPKELHVIDIPGNYHADRIFSVAASEIDPLFSDCLRKYTLV